METLTSVTFFVVYALLVVAFYALTGKGKARWAEIRDLKCPYGNLCVFLLLTAGITFVLCIAFILLDNSTCLPYDDWFYNLIIVLPFFSVMMGLFLFLFSPADCIEYKGRTESSSKTAEPRPWYFYLIFLTLFPVLPAGYALPRSNDAGCMLGGFPFVLAASSLAVNILLIVSNKRHNIGIHDIWSKSGITYAFLVALAYPIMHSAWFVGVFNDANFDPTDCLFVYLFDALIVYGSAYFVIRFLIYMIAGYKVEDDTCASDWGSMEYGGFDIPSYTKPHRPYRSILDAPEISDDYFGIHGEFDLNDESRRISEDIQQFHSSFPDADLSEHYQWEDILDAETDGYLDED